jgi:intracellular sulfur oxidation DsrE/DsrF family protein
VTTAAGATVALRNVINLRAELGGVAVEVVTQGAGLDLVLTATGRPELAELVAAGVTFSACRNTLNSRGLQSPT